VRELDACGIGFVGDTDGRASRSIITAALTGLARVKHRGAVAADARTSDGTGLLTTIPPLIFGEGTGVAMLFVRGDDPREAIESAAADEGLEVVEWREPPTDDTALGDLALSTRPLILQALLRPTAATADQLAAMDPDSGDPLFDTTAMELEKRTYRLRRRIVRSTTGTYVASCSFRTIVYKGLVAADALDAFYLDLADERFEAPLAIFHQRFSTNTLPTWERAQPFRMLCHNGEINTIAGNENRMRARGRLGTVEAGLGAEELFRPVLDPESSDSGMLDQAAELLVRGGRNCMQTMAMLVPEAWEESHDLDPEVRGFYEYHSALMEPWDGPAGVIFTDGKRVGAILDRNGLRPLRFAVCEDGLVVCASEMGAVDTTGHGAVDRGRLGPGHMFVLSPLNKRVVRNHGVKDHIAGRDKPYAAWAGDGFYDLPHGEALEAPPDDLLVRQAAHGFTKEELAMMLKPMAADAYEPTFAMGDDTPLAALAGRPRPIAHFLKQRFAQVTNPPIDPLRERLVMSLRTLLGPRAPLLSESADAARLLAADSFFVFPSGVDALLRREVNPFFTARFDATFSAGDGPAGLEAAVRELAEKVDTAVADGAAIVVLDNGAVSAERVPIPSLLALGAVHQELIATRRRSDTSLVVVADDVRDTHSIAALVGYGADLVCPRLALQTVAAEADESESGDLVSSDAQERFQAAVEGGVLKILSKMGISTIDSYRGAQIFEVIGLADEVVDVCFTGSANHVSGIGWLHLGQDALALHAEAFPPDVEPTLASPGYYRDRKGGEYHTHTKEVTSALNVLALTTDTPPLSERDPQAVEQAAAHLLQRAIKGESYDKYEDFVRLVDQRPPTELNDLLQWRNLRPPVPLDEVESVRDIATRFSTGAMSHGSLSREAHETLAQAMNLIGGRSNCGEGGEDPYRFHTRGLGREDKNSRIKQVASGRFGVTPEYLAHADELQIKMAQGSKPGEGGQLPGHKVSAEIARLRHTQPGVGLISPPPHHDIYSIEDLAQLIFDLKQVNAAQVSVKLVSTDNVGTIAAGVVKALADVVHISGGNGGTGASPLSSIKHAGMPWEIGLADSQRALVDNGLRGRVRLRVDGGFMTGRHVLIAALLGADEYSFGTAAMIAEGCVMLRACHRDTCKPGVATQRPHLRANFTGTPEGVAAYFMFVAEEVRHLLAAMGARHLDEVIGMVDLLAQRPTGDERMDAFDLSFLLEPPEHREEPRHYVERVELQDPRSELGDQLLADAYRAIWDGDDVSLAYPVANGDRSVGAALSGALALEYGTLPPRGTARVLLHGSAGQSFGVFLGHGVELTLVGEANDYVGKGMGGGRIVIRPPADDANLLDRRHAGSSTVLAGNTCLYGATGGELFVAGAVGERFAVRNSGALAIVEAVGDHCCEYMTGGTVVVLGRMGYNLGAGMTGGQAFAWDPVPERVLGRVNHALVEVLRPDHDALEELRYLVERHAELTGSGRASELLARWDDEVEHLWHILPQDRAESLADNAARRVTTA
jgi:glutamate synthase domain-containing protein 2/glutamate synthase domain-containing protein 1/glutamate synthase domain-containing protein 3